MAISTMGTTAHISEYREVHSRSGLAADPLAVTLNDSLRRSTTLIRLRAYIGAVSAETAIPERPEDPAGSCGLTLCRRMKRYSRNCMAAVATSWVAHQPPSVRKLLIPKPR